MNEMRNAEVISTADDEIVRLRAALRLIWRLHIRKHPHLGLERESGIENDCIPCICCGALGENGFSYSADVFNERMAKIMRKRG